MENEFKLLSQRRGKQAHLANSISRNVVALREMSDDEVRAESRPYCSIRNHFEINSDLLASFLLHRQEEYKEIFDELTKPSDFTLDHNSDFPLLAIHRYVDKALHDRAMSETCYNAIERAVSSIKHDIDDFGEIGIYREYNRIAEEKGSKFKVGLSPFSLVK
jgi:hypothetical protein